MSTSKFRAYTEDELPNLEFRGTKEEALADAVARAVADGLVRHPHPPDIIVEEVRDATLSDFLDASQVVSLMREVMQEKIGNDDALSDGAISTGIATAIQTHVGPVLDATASDLGVRIDGYITISKYVSRNWHGPVTESET